MRRIAQDILAKADAATVDDRIASLAARQHGVVALSQLVDLGLSSAAVRHRAAVGRLHRVHRGVYMVGHPALTSHGRRLAAVLACGTEAVLSHATAAAVWGIRPTEQALVDVTTTAAGGRVRPRGVRLHRTRRLHEGDRGVRSGLPLTSPARTLVDLAGALPAHALERAVHQAAYLDLLDVVAVRDAIDRLPGRRGSATLRTLLATPSPGHTRSELEARFLALCRDAPALGVPRLNVHLHGHEVDALFDAERVIVELDGEGVHSAPRAFHRDRRRDAALAARGYLTIRLTWERVTRESAGVADELARILALRRPTE